MVFQLFSSSSFAFSFPERFDFSLNWKGADAARSSIEIVEEGDFLRIISTVQSLPYISKFYPIDDRIETKLLKTPSGKFFGRPVTVRIKINEGWHHRDKEFVFEHEGRKVTSHDFIKKEFKHYDLQPDVLDTLSSFFVIRNMNLEVGKSVFVDIFDGKKVWNVEVQVLRKEHVKTPAGDFNAVVLKPILKFEGIFPSRWGDMLIWLSDDVRKIPVQLYIPVIVGAVTAKLVGGKY